MCVHAVLLSKHAAACSSLAQSVSHVEKIERHWHAPAVCTKDRAPLARTSSLYQRIDIFGARSIIYEAESYMLC